MARRKKQTLPIRIISEVFNYLAALLVWIILAVLALIIAVIPVINKEIIFDALAADYDEGNFH